MQGRAVLLHAFDAQGPEELSAYRGEEVRIEFVHAAGMPADADCVSAWRRSRRHSSISLFPCALQVDVEAEVDGWLHCVNARGRKGLLPASYLRIVGPGEAATPRSARRQPSQDYFSMVRMIKPLHLPLQACRA